MEQAKKRQFFSKKLISRKNRASEEAIFFQRKKPNIDVICRWEKKIDVSRQNWSGKMNNTPKN